MAQELTPEELHMIYVSLVFEFILLKDTNCDLLLKYEENHSRLFR